MQKRGIRGDAPRPEQGVHKRGFARPASVVKDEVSSEPPMSSEVDLIQHLFQSTFSKSDGGSFSQRAGDSSVLDFVIDAFFTSTLEFNSALNNVRGRQVEFDVDSIVKVSEGTEARARGSIPIIPRMISTMWTAQTAVGSV